MPTYICSSLKIGKAKQKTVQLEALTITATAFVNLEPPLSMATRFNSPAKMIAIPTPTN